MGRALELDAAAMGLVNACLTSQIILELYELDDVFDWDALRRTAKQQLSGSARTTRCTWAS